MFRVCVVGAGAAGLCAARHLAADPTNFRFTVFEHQDDIGGTWRYNERTGQERNGQPVHSSMYKNLITNLPMEIMSFPDFPYTKGGPSFVHHSVVLQYLEDYARHYDLHKHIQFHSQVEGIRLHDKSTNADDVWQVDVLNLDTGNIETLDFDAVIICVGAFSKPYCPDIPGLDSFEGAVMHSHNYRVPDSFCDKNVVVLGAGSSGIDIAMEVSTVAIKVIMSHNTSLKFSSRTRPERLTESPGIASVHRNKVHFLNGETFDADSIILCTGYQITAPSLVDFNVGLVETERRRLPTMYKHVLHINHPTLAVLGLIFHVLPFPMYHQLIKYLLSFWKGKTTPPCRADMLEEIEKDFMEKTELGWPVRHAHYVSGEFQWRLHRDLERYIGKLPPHYELIYKAVHKRRSEDPRLYKKDRFVLNDDCTFEHITGDK